jgi:sialate O-acetylesterase
MRVRKLLLSFAVLLLPLAVRADVKPSAICSEGMVLQQKTKSKIWGTADKGEKVTVSFRGKETSGEAGSDGQWSVAVETGEAGGPFPLSISGKNKIQYANVLVGEVWVCSGQSNMEWSVNAGNDSDKDSAKSTPVNPMLRMFTVRKNPQPALTSELAGTWVEAKPESVGGFSAVGYFFGRDLQKSIKVPVGLIHTSWGGTRAEAWTSRAVLDATPEFKFEHEAFGKQLEAFKNDSKLKNPVHANAPSALYNGMIYPILNYAIKGAIWYQGESNAGKAYQYRTLFPLMIKNWRDDWKSGELPFLFVQLAPFTAVAKEPGESNWAELREAQLLTLKLPHTGMAVITDYGDETDIHPTPKQPVGERLSLIARATTYGEKVEYSGPLYKDVKIDGSKAVLSFTHLGGGLEARKIELTERPKNHKEWRVKEGSAELVGFTVCGEDRKFHPAKAVIQGDTVVVTSEAVTKPVAVRYGWAQHPVCNLYNKTGLPATPFRTDEFAGITAPKK